MWDIAHQFSPHVSVLCADSASVCGNRPPPRAHPGHNEPHSARGAKNWRTPIASSADPQPGISEGQRAFSDAWRRGSHHQELSEKSLGWVSLGGRGSKKQSDKASHEPRSTSLRGATICC